MCDQIRAQAAAVSGYLRGTTPARRSVRKGIAQRTPAQVSVTGACVPGNEPPSVSVKVYGDFVTGRYLKRTAHGEAAALANIGYARCSTLAQDLTSQRHALAALGVPDDRVYLDKGLTGTNRSRPGLDQALAAVREGDTFTVTKLDRLARSVPDALAILSQLSARGVRFALGGSVHDWNDPFGRMFLQILAVIAEFEANLIRQRTREGMAIARQNGKLRGKQPTLKPAQDREIRRMHDSCRYNIADIAALFNVSRPTVYRSLERTATLPPASR